MKTLLLIDANSLIHRAFHALPPLTSLSGEPTGALYGFSSIILKILTERKPDYIAAAFDRPEPTFREQQFKDYKATRPETPHDLRRQIGPCHNLLETLTITTFEEPGFEADDFLGSLVNQFRTIPELRIIVLTGDLDLLQLVDDEKVFVETPHKGVSQTTLYDEKAVVQRFGVSSKHIPDYKGLVGDTSDNIPGVKGIGPTTATRLLKQFEDLDRLYEALQGSFFETASGRDKKLYEKLLNARDTAFLSRELARLRLDAPLNSVSLHDLSSRGLSLEKLIPFFEQFGFKSLINRIS